MTCPVCGQRKARRACPALGQTICTVCCGTKRLTEIACPSDCTYLAAAREHPAAVVRKQQEHDVGRLMPTIQHLTERQHQLFFLFNTAVARHTPDGFVRLTDADVAEAAEAVAATLETAARGVIYEQVPSSLPAQRLARELQTLVSEMRSQGTTVYDREAAITLRAIAKGARDTSGEGADYLALMGRLLQMNRAAADKADDRAGDPPPGRDAAAPGHGYAGGLAAGGLAASRPAPPGPAQPGPAQPGPAQPGPAQPGPTPGGSLILP